MLKSATTSNTKDFVESFALECLERVLLNSTLQSAMHLWGAFLFFFLASIIRDKVFFYSMITFLSIPNSLFDYSVFSTYVQPYFSLPAILSVLFYLDRYSWELLNVWSGRLNKIKAAFKVLHSAYPTLSPRALQWVSFIFHWKIQSSKQNSTQLDFFSSLLN